MRSAHMPKLHFLNRSQLGEDSWQSLLISLLRGMAAVQVAAAHLRAEVFPSLRMVSEPSLWYLGLAFLTGFAHQAVLVFFLLSGWLVGGSLLNKMEQPHALAHYAIDRVTRLWTVLVPTFVLILLFGAGMGVLSPGALDFAPGNEYSATAFAGNLLGLQTVALPNFGGNYPLWSLANETWYYLMFPLCVLMFYARTTARRLASAAGLVVAAAFLPYAIVLYFATWLLGVASSRIRIDCSNAARVALVALLGAVSVYYRMTGSNDDLVPGSFVQDLVCSIVFLAFLCTTQAKVGRESRLARPLAAFGKFFADFSFTLYVMHVPLIVLLRHIGKTRFGRSELSPHAAPDLALYLGLLAIVLACSYLSYLLFESQTGRIRRALKGLVLRRPGTVAPARAVPLDS